MTKIYIKTTPKEDLQKMKSSFKDKQYKNRTKIRTKSD